MSCSRLRLFLSWLSYFLFYLCCLLFVLLDCVFCEPAVFSIVFRSCVFLVHKTTKKNARQHTISLGSEGTWNCHPQSNFVVPLETFLVWKLPALFYAVRAQGLSPIYIYMLYHIHKHKLHSPFLIIFVPKSAPMTAVERRLRRFGQGASMSLCHKQSAKGLHDHACRNRNWLVR